MPKVIHNFVKCFGDSVCYATAVIRATTCHEAMDFHLAEFGGGHYSGAGQTFANEPYYDGWDNARKGYRITQRCGLDI